MRGVWIDMETHLKQSEDGDGRERGFNERCVDRHGNLSQMLEYRVGSIKTRSHLNTQNNNI